MFKCVLYKVLIFKNLSCKFRFPVACFTPYPCLYNDSQSCSSITLNPSS